MTEEKEPEDTSKKDVREYYEALKKELAAASIPHLLLIQLAVVEELIRRKTNIRLRDDKHD